MMDFIHKWTGTVALVIIAIVVLLLAFSGGAQRAFGAVDTTCQSFTTCLSDLYLTTTGGGSGSFRAAGSMTVDGATTLTGTTTVTQGVDGFVVGGPISTAATGTPVTVYTNTGSPKICDAQNGYFYAKNNGLFSPSLTFSVGTSTGSVPTANVLASTTVATTSTTIQRSGSSVFKLDTGDSLVAEMADITNLLASSTYYSRWSVEYGVWCNNASI